MNGYLIDKSVLSAFGPGKPLPQAHIRSWFERQSEHLFLSVITVIEIEAGIRKLYRTGATRKADQLTQWFRSILDLYSDRILAVDVFVAEKAGEMTDAIRANGHAPGLADIAIAATASVRELTVLTRNTRHFQPIGIVCFDPFEGVLPE